MIDFLYANGCSWTAGHGIEDHPSLAHFPLEKRWSFQKKYAWPAVLASLLNVNYLNEAEGAGSNKRMVRTTIDFILNYPKEKYSTLFVVLGWTTVDRNEFHIKENASIQGWCRVNASQLLSTYGKGLIPNFSNNFLSNLDDWHKLYLTYIFNYYANYTYFFQEMILMSNFLENLNIKYMFFNSLPWRNFWMPKEDTIDVESIFDKQITFLQKPQILSTRKCNDEFNVMMDFVNKNKLPLAKDRHTMIEGHAEWAKHLNSEFINLYENNE